MNGEGTFASFLAVICLSYMFQLLIKYGFSFDIIGIKPEILLFIFFSVMGIIGIIDDGLYKEALLKSILKRMGLLEQIS
jgi:hypothetical protein